MTAWFLWQTKQKDGGANIAMASRFLWLRISYVCLILSFHWFISASFSILAFFKDSWSLTGGFFSNNIYVALVTQGLLCYNIATLGMFTSFSGGSRGGARGARNPPPPPLFGSGTVVVSVDVMSYCLVSWKLLKTIYRYITNTSMVWWPAQRER